MRTSLRPFASISKSLVRPRSAVVPVLRSPFFSRAMSSAGSVLKQPVKLACIQLASGTDKQANLKRAAEHVAQAAAQGNKIVILPECFNSPYGTKYFPQYAETLLPSPPPAAQAPSFHALAKMAADNKVYLIGGSIPEFNPDTKKHYNTNLIFGPDGALLASHRKVHLFDIDIPGKVTFRESDVLSPGNKVTIVDLPEYGKIAVAICYDLRFPELATIAARHGAFALIYPGAFNTTTGALHWRLLGQARAVDNQIYVALCSPARDVDCDYPAWGHSLVVDPMAKVLVEADESETIVEWELEGDKIAETRKNIPLNTQRRFDVYPDVSKGDVEFEKP
ncbi:Omega-amidase nit3 [Neonectria magnoliae]|uniref:Omega-amidase nit3 n=1 Tax=Neonectria magnoliae TaxID=2732573 RepID=A0ABR1HST2_9HYPO